MKSKIVIGILVLAILLCQGIAFAAPTETVETAKATAEDAIAGGEDPMDMMAGDDNVAPADELYTPDDQPAQEGAVAETPEAKKM